MTAKLPGLSQLRSMALFAAALLAGCAPGNPVSPDDGNPLIGRVWDVRAGQFVAPEAAIARARAARIVVLGETHDNAEHHRLQAKILEAILDTGRRPVLAMEQFDRARQPALDAARARGERDPERLADAGGFDRAGWRWPDYRPLVRLAAENGLVLRAANFSREEARALIRSGKPAPDLPAASAAQRAMLERDIIEGHCGHRPPAPVLTGMVEAQRARDAQMARSLQDAGASGAVLIAGAGHARSDRGAALYLPPEERGRLLSLAFLEVEAGKTDPQDYLDAAAASGRGPEFDLVWFTRRAVREDPCLSLRMPAGGTTG